MSPPSDDPTRRGLVSALAGLVTVGSLAGCTSDETGTPTTSPADDASNEDDDRASPTPDRGTDTPGGDEGTATMTTELDLAEANVVSVEFTDEGGSYRFDVTLQHDDDGEDGYANWWQVERLNGTRLGRRELLHPHSNQPFTRSETIEIPDDVPCVVVRGHDQTHGYGGRAMLVNLDSGATRAVDQGAEQESFTTADCP